jgi:hypothetical protein
MAPSIDVLAVYVSVGSNIAVLCCRRAIPPPAMFSKALGGSGNAVYDFNAGDASVAIVFVLVLDV